MNGSTGSTGVALAVALAVTLGAPAAHAGQDGLHLSPTNTNFVLQGSFYLQNYSNPLQCKLTLSGTTSDGSDKKHAGLITGGSAKGSGCRRLSFLNLPWQVSLFRGPGGDIEGLSYQAGGNVCESEIHISISNKGVWSLGTGGVCGVSGHAKSTPVITVEKP